VCQAEVESANGILNDLTCDLIRQYSLLETEERRGEERRGEERREEERRGEERRGEERRGEERRGERLYLAPVD
jgi:hypothetical protein